MGEPGATKMALVFYGERYLRGSLSFSLCHEQDDNDDDWVNYTVFHEHVKTIYLMDSKLNTQNILNILLIMTFKVP